MNKQLVFILNGLELQRANAFFALHKQLHADEDKSAIGGEESYQFTPTGVGVLVIVKCSCGDREDVTDVTDW